MREDVRKGRLQIKKKRTERSDATMQDGRLYSKKAD